MLKAPTLGEMASIVRSKNAGPFLLTIDVLFVARQHYEDVKATRALTADIVAERYRLSRDDVLAIHYWDAANAIKVVMRRRASAGAPDDTDCYGAQQHVPLLDLPCTAVRP